MSEVFVSVQGEGPKIGVPAVFLRLSGCNLRCPWCDTRYAWERGERISVEALAERVRRLVRASHARLLVVTGGEPLLQSRCLARMVELLGGDAPPVALETNGTLEPGPLAPMIDHAVVSPKLGNSMYGGTGDPRRAAVHQWWLRAYHRGWPRVYWKFVVGGERDLAEVDEFVERHGIRPEDVWLMPLSFNVEQQARILPILVGHAIRRGYNVTPRLQHLAGVR